MAAFGGPISGIVALYLFAALVRWTGAWIGGRASTLDIRAAIAWSSVPLIWAMLLWIPEIAIFGRELFTTATPRMDANPSLAFLLMGFGIVEVGMAVWGFVVYLKCLGQVQGFSAWKAWGNVMLALLVIAVPLVVIFALATLV